MTKIKVFKNNKLTSGDTKVHKYFRVCFENCLPFVVKSNE